MKLRKKFLIWIIPLSLILILLFTHFYVPRFITEIKNPIIQAFRLKRSSHIKTFPDNLEVGKLVHFQSSDSLKLEAYLRYAQHDTLRGTIILLHGIRASKEDYLDISAQLAKQGFNSVALDLRAHGNSEGRHCTFGVKEKHDISQLVSFLLERENLAEPIGIWGRSLGGAVALQALAYDPRLQFGIVESTFTEFKLVARDYFQHYLGFSFPLLEKHLIKRAGQMAQFDPRQANPLGACIKIEQPMLMIHGTRDEKINILYGRQNFSFLKTKQKEFIEVEGAHHHDVWKVGGKALFKQIDGFLEGLIPDKSKSL